MGFGFDKFLILFFVWFAFVILYFGARGHNVNVDNVVVDDSKPYNSFVGDLNDSNSLISDSTANYVDCNVDADCVRIFSCCHPNAQACVPRSGGPGAPRLIRPELCKNIVCTMDCRPCTTCKCVNGSCETIYSEGGCC